jgi:hypothetical protein
MSVGLYQPPAGTSSDPKPRPAASHGKKNGVPQRAGKQVTAQNAPVSLPPPTEEEMENMRPVQPSEPEIKVEDAMDEDQIARLANGITIDTTTATSTTVCSPILHYETAIPTDATDIAAASWKTRKNVIY